MLSRFQRKLGSLLGLFAILMATLAPTVSQGIAAHRGASGYLDALCSTQATPVSTTTQQSDSQSMASHMQACGYCSLLAHLPLLPTVAPTFALIVWVIQHRVATRFESVRRIVTYTAAQPRAPPVLS